MASLGKWDIVVRARATPGESPVWDGRVGVLWWVDINGGFVHRFDPRATSDEAIPVGQPVGALALRERGGLVLAMRDGFAFLDPETGQITPIVTADADASRRFNDGKVDAAGRFWAGTMAFDLAPRVGALYRLDADGTLHTMLTEVSISNGLDWSPDGATMYYTDSLTRGIDAFDFDAPRGTITARRRLISLDDAKELPDGLTVDAEGAIWIAIHHGGRLHRYAPDGSLDRVVPAPLPSVTSMCFGGADLRTMYVTTFARGPHPDGGSLFAFDPGVGGRAANRFSG